MLDLLTELCRLSRFRSYYCSWCPDCIEHPSYIGCFDCTGPEVTVGEHESKLSHSSRSKTGKKGTKHFVAYCLHSPPSSLPTPASVAFRLCLLHWPDHDATPWGLTPRRKWQIKACTICHNPGETIWKDSSMLRACFSFRGVMAAWFVVIPFVDTGHSTF